MSVYTTWFNMRQSSSARTPGFSTCPWRVRTVHLKPHSRAQGTRSLIGEDDLPWREILRLCRTAAGTEWYIVDYESDGYPRMEVVQRCLDALKRMV